MDQREYVLRGHTKVPGWFYRTDALLFDAIDSSQRHAGITGDLLEIGCYQGASAILLGFMRQQHERFIVCDLFDEPTVGAEDEEERSRFYSDLSRRSFESNYLRFHATLPEIVEGPSVRLSDGGFRRSFRVIHIDGSHVYEAVRSDLLLAKELLMPGGIVVFDDIVSIHTPGVTAAVWVGVSQDGLVPMIQSRKFYGTWGTPIAVDIPSELTTYADDVCGFAMIHVDEARLDGVAPERSVEDSEAFIVSDRERSVIETKRRLINGLNRRIGRSR